MRSLRTARRVDSQCLRQRKAVLESAESTFGSVIGGEGTNQPVSPDGVDRVEGSRGDAGAQRAFAWVDAGGESAGLPALAFGAEGMGGVNIPKIPKM